MYRLEGVVQHYNWGGKSFLPGLLNIDNKEQMPFAEYWLGIHPLAPSKVDIGQGCYTTLSSLVNSDKRRYLGSAVRDKFNAFPYLLKILDVHDMLSIQVHPTKEDAFDGFTRENEKGVPLNAPDRNYKDGNHKPEMMVALSEFWLLHGFLTDLETPLQKYDFLHPFTAVYRNQGIKGLYKTLMELSQDEVNKYLAPLAERIIPLYQSGKLSKNEPDFWAARAIENLCGSGEYDRGIFSIYLFNIIKLLPGEAIFQGAGMPHAYLEGQNIELMSNSDNVLRAGLTSKHIDIPELLRNTQFVSTAPNIIGRSLNKMRQTYPVSVPDFSLSRIILPSGATVDLKIDSPQIFLSIAGSGCWFTEREIQSNGLAALFLSPGEALTISAEEDMDIFIAGVPV